MKRSALAVILGALALLPAGPAAAQQTARYKKQEVQIQGVPQTQLTKPAPPPKEQKTRGGPVISLEEFVQSRQEKVRAINDKQIKQIQRLIRITEDSDPDKAKYHFMLAELFSENQRFHFFSARALDQKIFEARGGEKSPLQRQQRQHEQDQEKWLLQAVGAYVEASKFKKFPSMDEVLFKLAHLLQTVKKEEQALLFFQRLIKEHPDSKYVPHAYLSFGERDFQAGEMDRALEFYKRVERFPKSDIYGYAVYKKGWCYINLGDFKQALSIFQDVIRISKEGRGGDKRQNQALEREAKKDVVKAYARVGMPDKAWDYFRRVGDDMAPKMFEALAELYWEQGMFKESTYVYRQVIALNKESPRVCEWQNKVVRNTLSSGAKREQLQELGRLGLAYGHVFKMQNAKKDLLTECKNVFHDTSNELTRIWHSEAQKTKNPDTYALTRYMYKLYLEHFPNEKGAVDMRFYYGEILWMTENWREAAEQYTKVVEMDPRGKYLQEAAKAAVLAWQNALNVDDGGQGPDKDKLNAKDLKPKPIPDYQKKMIAAFDVYLKYVPSAPELAKIKYKKARIYYDYNHFDDAVKLFQQIVDKHPGDELGVISANLLLDSLNIMGRTQEVVATVDRFSRMPELMKDAEFQKQMTLLRIDSLDVEGRRFDEEGNFKECAISKLAAAESAPDHPKHAERLWDAAVCFQNANLIGRAIQARDDLIKMHPKDPLAQKALYRSAAGYHQIATYTRAAELYEQFATKFPGEKQAPIALGNAYQFRLGLGEWDKAVEDANAYVKFYGDRRPEQAADVFYQVAEVYEKQNKTEELVRHLKTYIQRWGNKGNPDKVILAHFKIGEIAWKKSCPKEGAGGACIEIKRVSATGRQKAFYEVNRKIKDKRKKIRFVRTQCGPPTSSKITVFDRSKSLAKDAQTHFDQALKLWRSNAKKIDADRLPFAGYAAAGAAFYQAERIYEDFLRVEFPEGLHFQAPGKFDSPRKAKEKEKRNKEDQKKFKAYLDSKSKLAARLSGSSADKKGAYDAVVDFKSAHWTIAAAARVGQVWANFVDQLYTAEIPKDLKDADEWGVNQREIFCDTLVDTAEPIETKAVGAYGLCLKAATQESWFNEWSTLCEQELNQMQPSEYPLAAEAKPEPGYVSTPMMPAPVLLELPVKTAAVLSANNK